MSKGWECPKCGRVYAPHISQCDNCEPIVHPQEDFDKIQDWSFHRFVTPGKHPCEGCSNNKPGQINICHCTLPYMYNPIC